MCFSTKQAQEFYARLQQKRRQQEVGGMTRESEVLVPTIDVRKAQATKEEDKRRIFDEIGRAGGIDAFNAQLQAFMEAALQEEARGALVAAAAGSVQASAGKVTLAGVQADLKGLGMKHEQAMQEMQQEMRETREQVQAMRQEMQQEIQEARAALEAKLEAVLAQLAGV